MTDSYVGYAPANRLSLAAGSVGVGALATTGTASSSTYLRGDMAWASNPLGDVTGPGSSTDDALAKFDSTTGKVIQNSNATLSDAGVLTVSSIAATVTTAAQPNITSLGTIASLVATTADINAGTFDGIVGGTTPAAGTFTTLSGTTSITGTLATAAQTNITSLGTITGFTSTGIDDNAASTAVILDGSQNVLISKQVFVGGATASIAVSNGQQNWVQQHEASNRGGTTWFSTHASAGGAESVFAKGRSGTLGSYTIVQDGDNLGRFTWCADDGVDMNSTAAQLSVTIDGTPGANDTPGKFEFLTTADGAASPTLRMSLNSSGQLNLLDNELLRPIIRDYCEPRTNMAPAATVTLDMTNGNVFALTPDQNTTFAFSNPGPANNSTAFTLVWTQDSTDRTITWPGTVDWAGGSAPDVTSGNGKVDIYTFFTLDSGSKWYGFQAGADVS